MNYYPFHIGDFRSGTVNMSRQSRWIYRDMLDVYYDSENPLNLDLDILCDSIGVEDDAERKIVERLLKFKFQKTDQGYRHEICDAVICEYHLKAETAKANGKLGGRPKKNTKEPKQKPSGFQSGSDPVTKTNPDITGSEANQEPRTSNQEPVTKNHGGGKEPPRSRATAFPCPDDVDQQIWTDWLSLRKAKRAPVTETVVNGAREESQKAGINLQSFLKIWCTRGSQGLQADWIKSAELAAARKETQESFRERDDRIARERYAEMVGRPVDRQSGAVFDITPTLLETDHASPEGH